MKKRGPMPLSQESPSASEYVRALVESRSLGPLVVHRQDLPARQARFAGVKTPWRPAMEAFLSAAGIGPLYSHQAEAMDLARAGRDVVTATPTASGKTFIYNLPVIERSLARPGSRALYLFPLKALAQDQLKAFNALAENCPEPRPRAAVYDGDTTAHFRKKIRDNPPDVLITNPEMLHLALLPFHDAWAEFFANLAFVVVDEVHTYRGIMGSHMAWVFARLMRICARYGASPSFICSSATIANPGELCSMLTGREFAVIEESGAPASEKQVVFVNPDAGPARVAIELLKAALARELRTIVYTQSRRLTELIALWASEKAGDFAPRISAYRAGYLAEERRDIEAKLSSGELLAVVSTSALELGIDIGNLDVCILVGYPGTLTAAWQRGGRVGRGGSGSAMILVAGEDALDQYFMRHPDQFFSRPMERAVINPDNPVIRDRHLVCAASDLPLKSGEPFLKSEKTARAVERLVQKGELLLNAAGDRMFAAHQRPHRDVDLRGAGRSYRISLAGSGPDRDAPGRTVGQVDGVRVFREVHPGAIYLHHGDTFLVADLSPETRTAMVERADVDHYTKALASKSTEILEVYAEKAVAACRVGRGRLRVTDQVTGYEKRQVRTSRRLGTFGLDLPPSVFETEGLWIVIPDRVLAECEEKRLHFMGGIHAVEHAAIGILPLLVMTDRNDLGGISTPLHPQIQGAAVFVYDAMPGGAGLSAMAFARALDLLEKTRDTVASCPCDFGCPGCVHSPKCGSGNRPIHKEAALFVLSALLDPGRAAPAPREVILYGEPDGDEKRKESKEYPKERKDGPPGRSRASGDEEGKTKTADSAEKKEADKTAAQDEAAGIPPFEKGGPGGIFLGVSNPAGAFRYGVLDIETRLSAQEVGGWHNARCMGISVAVLYDSATDDFYEYHQPEIGALIRHLQKMDLVVGFNILRFDYQVLSGATEFDFSSLPTLDLLDEIKACLGYRLSLDHLAAATLGTGKSASGLQALKWWKEGRMDLITEYCARDVAITRDLYLHGLTRGHLLFTNKARQMVRVPASWAAPPDGQEDRG
ncbi:MAG: DEAD/DEAH box helicase [Pseudomonadota bacterium]